MRSEASVASIDDLAHTRVCECYQCGKCSAGCPVGEQMDILPHQLIRLVQLGCLEEAMSADSIWKCVSCLTCSTRCPKSVECAGVVDALREFSAKEDVVSKRERRTEIFQRVFLENIRRNGRLNEVELVIVFKTKGFLNDLNVPLLLKDATLAPRMLGRGKFHLVGEKVKNREVVQRIFSRCEATA